jgi:PadR family transcriptional regulator PadR
MKNPIQLTQLQLVLLLLVDKGRGNLSWYELANSLSRLDIVREPDMMVVLKDLVAQGLLERHIQPGSPRDRWEITPVGTEFLRHLQQLISDPDAVKVLKTFAMISLDSTCFNQVPVVDTKLLSEHQYHQDMAPHS